MVGIIIASHGDFASGLKHTSEMIFGHQDYVITASLQPNQGPDDIYEQINTAILTLNTQQIIIFVDLLGGTPFNQASLLVDKYSDKSIYIISGMNLPLLLEAYGLRYSCENAFDIVQQLLSIKSDTVAVYPKVVNTINKENPVITHTVVSDNLNPYLDIVLARVDSRLLHGQVATGWCKTVKPNRILVVSDSVAHDTLRKKMISQAAPNGIKANCIPLSKFIEIQKDERFKGCKALVLFENLSDVHTLIQKGVHFDSINLGSLAHKDQKVSINAALSMDKHDVTLLENIINAGVEIDIRKVPADTKEDVVSLLKKARQMLEKE